MLAPRLRSPARPLSLLLIVTCLALLIVPLGLHDLAPAPAAADDWWDASWTRRMQLTLHNDTGATLTNHRVLVRLQEGAEDGFHYADTRPDGADLRFIWPGVFPNTYTVLPYQITRWDSAGVSTVFVQVPIVATGTSSFYLYYKNPNAPVAQDPDGTWSGDYSAVWTLQEPQAIFRDYESATATPAWGDYGSAVNLDYPAVSGLHPVGSPQRFKMQIQTAVYDPETRKTFVVYAGGEWELCINGPTPTATRGPMDQDEHDADATPTGTPKYPTNLCSPQDPYLVAFDHDTRSWSDPVKIGDAQDLNRDGHYYPTIALTQYGGQSRLIVFQGQHGRDVKIWYWTQASDVALSEPWAQHEIPQTSDNTYLASYTASDNTVYVIYRYSEPPPQPPTTRTPTFTPSPTGTVTPPGGGIPGCDVSIPWWHEQEAYVYSTDGGEHWQGPFNLVDPEQYPDWFRTIYVKAMIHEPATANRPEGISFLFGHHQYHNCTQSREFYAFFALGDLNNWHARTLYDAQGHPLNTAGTPVPRSTYDNPACATCLVYDESITPTPVSSQTPTPGGSPTPWPGYFARTVLGRDPQGRLNAFYNFRGNAFPLKWSRLEGPAPDETWVARDIPGLLGATLGAPYDVTFAPDGDVTIYLIAGEVGWKNLSLVTYQGHESGGTWSWTQTSVIAGPMERPGLNWFTLLATPGPMDAGSKYPLRAIFMELDNTGWQHPDPVGKLYGWGDYGLTKHSARAEATSPVGPALAFNPTPPSTPTPTRTPSITPTATNGPSSTLSPTRGYTPQATPTAQLDQVRVAVATISSAFTFPANDVAVEALLVRFADVSHYPQFVVSKDAGFDDTDPGAAGFRLVYTGGTQQELAWQVGYGSHDSAMVTYAGIAANQWYYVVGTFEQVPDVNQPWEQQLWVNATPATAYHASTSWTPSWGAVDLRLGGHSDESGCTGAAAHQDCGLEGWLGGYVAVLHVVPSAAYIQASYANFLTDNFVTFSLPEEYGAPTATPTVTNTP